VSVALGLGQRAGRIAGVEPGGPADRAGLREGDWLVRLDDDIVAGTDDLVRLLGADRVGRATTLVVIREGRYLGMTATPTERPAGAARRSRG
jgi:S1-C subfamily serine protease